MPTGKERFLMFCKEWLPRLIGNLLMVFFLGMAVYQFASNNSSDGSVGSRFLTGFRVILAWGYATVAGLFIVALYLPGAAEKITFGLLYPRRFLKKAPVSLSPVRGLITAGRFQEAGRRLAALNRDFPGHAEIAYMLFELNLDRLHRPVPAAAVAKRFFAVPFPKRDLFRFRLLMRYADLLQSRGEEQELITLMNRELKRKLLSETESAAVTRRLGALHSDNL